MKKQCLLCRVPDCALEEWEEVRHCPLHKFLHVVWTKWGVIVLLVLEQPHRFGELKRIIPDISEKMLITTLHDLEHAWYIGNEKIYGKQITSTYMITDLGEKALKIAESMAEMGKLL